MGETPCLFGEEGVRGLTAEAEGREWGFIFSLLGSFYFLIFVVEGRTRRTHWRCSGATPRCCRRGGSLLHAQPSL